MRRLVLTIVAGALTVLSPPANAAEQTIPLVIDGLAGPGVEPTSINNNGTIVGSISPGESRPVVPFRWTETGGTEFFLGDSPGKATDVNDAGAIVGYLEVADESIEGFLWTAEHGLVDLGGAFLPSAINNRGQIVGTFVGEFGATGPYLWDDGVFTELGGDVPYGIASDINAAGRVVGQQLTTAFVWSPQAGLTLLQGGGSGPSAAFGLNNSGEIVGFSSDAFASYPARWTRDGRIITFPLNGGTFVAVNDRGMAVGRYLAGSNWNAFVSTRGGDLIELGAGLPAAINDRGAVVGTAVVAGEPRVVVWLVSH